MNGWHEIYSCQATCMRKLGMSSFDKLYGKDLVDVAYLGPSIHLLVKA